MRKVTSILLMSLLAMSLFAGCSKTEPAMEEPTAEVVDVVTTASIVTDADAFVNALSADGTWIVAALNDITLDADLVIEGEFMNKEVAARKIAIYTQDADHNVIDRFTLTAPKMIVKSENMKLQGGTFVGDVYVQANGFKVSDATVEGNIVFASQEFKDSFVLDTEKESKVTGTMELEVVDVVTTASIVTDADAFVNALSADGTWIVAALNDITLDADLVIEGEFMNKEVAARKIAIYTQDADHNVIDRFTLTAPKMIVKSENMKLQGGTFVGDVYVQANGFKVSDATVEGNIVFASQEFKDSFILDTAKESKVTGTMELE